MIATLTFNLPDEKAEFEDAMNAGKYIAALNDLAIAFRSHRKYDAEPVTEEKFHEIIRERGVELE